MRATIKGGLKKRTHYFRIRLRELEPCCSLSSLALFPLAGLALGHRACVHAHLRLESLGLMNGFYFDDSRMKIRTAGPATVPPGAPVRKI